jgi:hypothetical protein
MILGGVLAVVVAGVALFSLDNGSTRGRSSSKPRVSQDEFARMKTGWTKTEVRILIGNPELVRPQRIGGLRMVCWFYNGLPSRGDNPYQLCFNRGLLARKYVVNHGSAA